MSDGVTVATLPLDNCACDNAGRHVCEYHRCKCAGTHCELDEE